MDLTRGPKSSMNHPRDDEPDLMPSNSEPDYSKGRKIGKRTKECCGRTYHRSDTYCSKCGSRL